MASRMAAYDGRRPPTGAGTKGKQDRPADRWRGAAQGGWIFGTLAFALMFAAIVWAARSTTPERRPAAVAPPDPWLAIVQPIPIFDLSNTMFGDARAYQAWRARSGPGRRDVLSFGDFDKGAFLRLAIEQPRPKTPNQPFFSDLARQAAYAGLILDRSAVPDGVGSRFGVLSVTDVILSRRGRRRACLAFRVLNPAARISGLACGEEERPFGRSELVCALDRLDLVGGGEESPLTRYFADTELARGSGCAADRLAPVKTRTTWLDAGAALPRLKAERTGRDAGLRSRRSEKL